MKKEYSLKTVSYILLMAIVFAVTGNDVTEEEILPLGDGAITQAYEENMVILLENIVLRDIKNINIFIGSEFYNIFVILDCKRDNCFEVAIG